ncbi:hypothetical protein [Oscillibacter ruminantium]|uniref:phage major capsid protein n=1 Tax=Oscillibacter ruminantium TaxID=1263547 RepID=UPI00332E0EF8
MNKKKYAQWLARQQELTDTAKRENREFTEAENSEFNELQRQIDEMKNQPENTGTPPTDSTRQAVEDERQRIADIAGLCREFGVDENQESKYIKDGTGIEDVRAAVLEHVRKNGTPIRVRVNEDEGDKFRAAAADALLMKSGVSVKTPAAGAADLRHMSLRDLAIECLVRDGHNAGEMLRMDHTRLYDQLAREFYNPSAAFPAILDATINKKIVTAYQSVPTTFERITTKGSLSDFKASKDHAYLIGGAGEFKRVAENGELQSDKPSTELLPERQLDTYGRQFSMTRQAFINDDIGFLSEVPGQYAASAKRTINKAVYSILVKNPTIYDGVALFHTSHKNLIETGCAPSNAALQAAILKMGFQTDPFGDAINIPVGEFIVPMGYGFTMRTILTSQTINTSDNQQAANPLYNLPVDVVEEPTINVLAGAGNAAPWFVGGDRTACNGIQVDYLNGQETPTIRRMETPGVLGFKWDIFLDWGITVRDFRGLVKNPGTVIN